VLERWVSTWSPFDEAIGSQERILETVGLEVQQVKGLVQAFRVSGGDKAADGPRQRTSTRETSPTELDSAADSRHQSKSATHQWFSTVGFGRKTANSLEGILLYLTTKHGGHVHEKGIVTITSKSFFCDDPIYLAKDAADFTYDCFFLVKGRARPVDQLGLRRKGDPADSLHNEGEVSEIVDC
jgi:hypothetical protein